MFIYREDPIIPFDKEPWRMHRAKINQSEMIKLAIGLADRDIPFTPLTSMGGFQIRCDGWDAICNAYSYGCEDGLIEVMGLPQCGDDVIGYLTADDILTMLDNPDKPYIDTLKTPNLV